MIDYKLLKEKFKCARCGNCCKWHGYVNVSIDEIEAIANYLKIDFDEYMDKYIILKADRRGLSITENIDGSCIYYEKSTGLCQIQAVKPQQCLNFPIKWNFDGFEKECLGAKNLIEESQ